MEMRNLHCLLIIAVAVDLSSAQPACYLELRQHAFEMNRTFNDFVVNTNRNLEELHRKIEAQGVTAETNQEAMTNVQVKLEHLENDLQDVQHKLGNLETNFQDVQQKLKNLENNVQGGHQEIKSFVHEEISKAISLSEKDECSEGSYPCGLLGICKNTLFSFTCSCPSGFTWDGSDCADIDECVQGKADCSSNQATCKNSLGSYSCSCNPPFEGDGRTCSCPFGFALNGDICEEIQCRSPAKAIRGLGCITEVWEAKTFQEMEDFCQEEGGRLLQKFDRHHLTDIKNNFGMTLLEMNIIAGWVGVYDEKWTSDESLVPGDLWKEGHRSDPLRHCGILAGFSSFLKVTQRECSEKSPGFCQFWLP